MRKNNSSGIIRKILKDKLVRTFLARKSLRMFFSIYYYDYIKYPTARFQEEMMNIIENSKNKFIVFTAFRGSAKSTIVTNASILWSILGKRQDKLIVILSSTEHKARQFLQNIKRELEMNDLLRTDLGPFDEERTQWGATAIIIKKFNAKIVIGSVEQSPRGLLFGHNRADLIILDDIEDLESVRTQQSRDKTFDWLTGEVIPLGDKKTRIIAVGNMLHDDSVMSRLKKKVLNKEVDGMYREYPIIDDNGKPLWPGKFPTQKDIDDEKRKVMNEQAWAREYRLKIVSNDDTVIKKEYIQYYDVLPQKTDFSAIGVDPAIAEKETSAFTAMVCAKIVGHGDNQYVYILPNPVNERMSHLDNVRRSELLSRTIDGNKLAELYVEDVGYQKAIIQDLKSKSLPVNGVLTYGQDKIARLMSVSHLIQSGRVLFPRFGAETLIAQLLGFGSEKYKDLADALVTLLRGLQEKKYSQNGWISIMEEDMKKIVVDPNYLKKPRGLNDWVNMPMHKDNYRFLVSFFVYSSLFFLISPASSITRGPIGVSYLFNIAS